MEMYEACESFSSLSQETRLKVFLFLTEYGGDGASAGTIAGRLKIPDNTLSFHLSHMSKVGLVSSQRNGRSITYFANTVLMNELVDFLLKNCCAKEKKAASGKSCARKRC